jgi:hypothetical protein
MLVVQRRAERQNTSGESRDTVIYYLRIHCRTTYYCEEKDECKIVGEYSTNSPFGLGRFPIL